MTERQTSRGWEWTADQRDAIKPWYRRLEKKRKEVRGILDSTRKSLPEFALDAERYATPFLEEAEELLSLDSRRKGRKWQHIPFSEVLFRLERTNVLYEDYRHCFLGRDDFQEALCQHNKGLRKHNRAVKQATREVIDEIVRRNLAEIAELRKCRNNLEVAVSSVFEQLNLFITLAVDIRRDARFQEPEVAALRRWLVIQYMDIAASMAPEVHTHVLQHINNVGDPEDLLPDVHLRLLEHDIHWYNTKIREVPEFVTIIRPGDATTPSFMTILNTIRHRLDKELLSHKGKVPSQMNFSFFGQDFHPATGEMVTNDTMGSDEE